MLPQIIRTAETIAVAGTVASMAYCALCLWSAASFLKRRKSAKATAAHLPPVSILKPLRGIDPGMYESFRSHCLLEFPDYEIVFGVSESDDPAIEFVNRLKIEFPERPIQLVICVERLGANVKVSNLAQMLPHARHEILIVNDSDIRIPRSYLQTITAPLTDASVGLVTCLYRGVAGETVGSRMESLGISTDFCAGALAALQLEGIKFGLGSTLVFRRRDLISIGGFQAIADYLADDYEIGKRLAARGLRIILSETVVESFLPAYSLGGFLQHQLRWARTLRGARPWGYLGLVFTFTFPWALLALGLSDGPKWAWSLLAAALAIRVCTALVVGRLCLQDRQVLSSLWLLPIRDVIAVFVWAASYAGREVAWRGDMFTLKNGKLARD